MYSLMFLPLLVLSSLAGAAAQNAKTDETSITVLTGTKSVSTKAPATGTYQSFPSKITLASTPSGSGTSMTSNSTGSSSTATSQEETVTLITGSHTTTVTRPVNGTGTASSTATQPAVTNTRPCNNWPEFCARKYSNITMVAAHNSPFDRAGSAASNQELGVVTQLDDGIRFLQAQIQWPTNGTQPHFCHTSCDILDAGPITDWLTKVKNWVAAHPYDVVTILLGNGNYSKPELYAPYIESTGIVDFAYVPPYLPMSLDEWPTLSDMILTGKRVVMFLDYNANQTAYPWLLDEFSQLWETPFDPEDRAFPCTVQRPPNLSVEDAKKRMYLVNHNLNVQVSLLGTSILVPATTLLNETNNATGFGSLGVSAQQCKEQWGRPPNFLNVDYYNYGDPPGSVFEVAAKMNNVTYDRVCCGKKANAADMKMLPRAWPWYIALVAAVAAWI
ncbi:uncharacterized protein E0L32_000031 [Thyridium curvatum]|uniref:PLC-like phosphodiesterase n=1 Tax=Thyridium curvatum TaxID=1093900 RepID=A0A507B7D8_9PEZI|nr:uncharacterized protein E0L32_000031 [Thyridium curvatum]TPX15697.1 hypothetical protein E0L32_000031 [Thyridium curvatum]